MNQNLQNNNNQGGGFHPLATFLLMSGGAVVGTDYATWLEIDPITGAIIGGVVSVIILQICYRVHRDENGEVRKAFTGMGCGFGVSIGAAFGAEYGLHELGWLFFGALGLGVGFLIGRLVAVIVSLFCLVILIISQGPIGLAVRTYILNLN